MRRWSAIAAALACAALLVWVALAGADEPLGTPVSYGTSAPPSAIADGFDGNLWFVEPGNGGRFGSITTAGTVTEAHANPAPTGIADGVPGTPSAGAVWVASGNADDAFVTAYTTPNPAPKQRPYVHQMQLLGAEPGAVAVDARGDVWVTLGSALQGDDAAVDMVLPGLLSSYTTVIPIPLGNAAAASIATGADGTTMWVTEPMSDEIASIALPAVPTSAAFNPVKQYPLPAGVSGTLGQIVLGPDGDMYAGLTGAAGAPSYVLQITPAGTITPFQLPSNSAANPGILAVGPDKLLWMAGGGMLTSMATSGTFTNYVGVLPAADAIGGIAPDPSADALWLTDATASAIWQVPLAPPPPPPPPAPPAPPPQPPTLFASVSAASDVTATAVTLSGTITEEAGSDATPATYEFEYGSTTDYGQLTPSATTTATPDGVTVTAQVSGLSAFTTYHYALIASDCTPPDICQSAVSPDQTFTTGAFDSIPPPVQNVSVAVAPVSGTVNVELPNSNQFRTLPAGASIPVGATIGTRNGTALIVSTIGPGQEASGRFSKGIFKVTQPVGGTVTVLRLVSNYGLCTTSAPVKARIAAAKKPSTKKRPSKKKPSKKKRKKKRRVFTSKVVSQVFGNAHGQFKTRGHYAVAADEGTAWHTTDRCDGTQIAVTQGTVKVTDFVHHRTIVLTAGHHYLAKAH